MLSRFDFVFVDQIAEGRGQCIARHQGLQVFDDGIRDRLTGVVPQHGAQLELDVERQPVVDRPDVILAIEEHVSRLAVGAVGNHVECRQLLEHRPVRVVVVERQIVLVEVARDEQLH